jgi:hypothetical protein
VRGNALVRFMAPWVAILLASHAYAEEGLFKREQIVLPPAVEQSIPAVVRVYSNLFFDVRVFADETALQDFAAAHPERAAKNV